MLSGCAGFNTKCSNRAVAVMYRAGVEQAVPQIVLCCPISSWGRFPNGGGKEESYDRLSEGLPQNLNPNPF